MYVEKPCADNGSLYVLRSDGGARATTFMSFANLKEAQEAINACVTQIEEEERKYQQRVAVLAEGSRIHKIKAVRDLTGCGLREAVAIVDNLLEAGRKS